MDAYNLMPIIIIEDDYLQAKTLASAFLERYQGRTVSVLDSEAAFRLRTDEVPALVVCDAMLPWTLPGEPEPIERPEEVDDPTGYIKAGNRCYQFARNKAGSSWKKVPWLFHTILSKEEMEFEATVDGDKFADYVGKAAGLDDVLIKVDKMLFDLSPESHDETCFFTNNPAMKRLLQEGLAVKSSKGLPGLAELIHAPI